MNFENTMTARPLGCTGLAVSALGFGSFKIGRNRGIKYAESYELPDELGLRELMAGVLSLGMCYIDTAPAYGTSEERLGRVLADDGEGVVISTKVGETFEGGESRYEFTPESTRASVERSALRLGREVLDMVFVHSDGNDLEIQDQIGVEGRWSGPGGGVFGQDALRGRAGPGVGRRVDGRVSHRGSISRECDSRGGSAGHWRCCQEGPGVRSAARGRGDRVRTWSTRCQLIDRRQSECRSLGRERRGGSAGDLVRGSLAGCFNLLPVATYCVCSSRSARATSVPANPSEQKSEIWRGSVRPSAVPAITFPSDTKRSAWVVPAMTKLSPQSWS